VESLAGKVAWITGAGTGIGEAAALALARAGAAVVLSGRRRQPLEAVAAAVAKAGGRARVEALDVARSAEVQRVAESIRGNESRLDILVNNAGLNVPNRSWARVGIDGIDAVISANLTGAFYVVHAALPLMRAQKDGVMIHTASWAGRHIGPISGPAYTAAKHGMVAMSHTINLEEGQNGIRSCVICPGEVATPILLNRPVPETAESMARMIQPADMGELILFIARQPPRVCINEVLITPTHNRGYLHALKWREAAAGKP